MLSSNLKCSFVLLFFAIAACSAPSENAPVTATESQEIEQSQAVNQTESEAGLSEDEIERLTGQINEVRAAIERSLGEPIVLENNDDWRPKVRQKWASIHVYLNEAGEVMRIKTYPHADVSERTEEFYFEQGNLILAVVEDDGGGERGKALSKLDKLYYYDEGKVINEAKSNQEPEFNMRESDAEELQQEAMEYMEMYRESKQSNS